MDTRPVLPADTVLDGTYRIERVIGTGRAAITYAAKDVEIDTAVAIKEYNPVSGAGPQSRRHASALERGRPSLLQQARILACLEHDSIVRVTRVFEANATVYMVMSFADGQTLEAWLADLGRPPTQAELDCIATGLLDAIEVMHSANLLHLDIAPDNILIRSDGTPLLVGFGSARQVDAGKSRLLERITRAFSVRPDGRGVDDGRQGPWTDLYSFGATFYRAVAGGPPKAAALRAGKDRSRGAAEAAQGVYRPGFLAAIDACLKVPSAQRPQSVAQLRAMLLASA